MSEFYFRTESIKKEDIFELFVESKSDREIIDLFKSKSHVVLEGSRGAGKSYLMRVAQYELDKQVSQEKIVPVYVTFMQSALIHTTERNQFLYWMLSKIIKETEKCFRKKGLIVSNYAKSLVNFDDDGLMSLADRFEKTYSNPNQFIDAAELPDLSDFMDAIEAICETNNIDRLVFFFDEAAHVFRPEQQRQFFSLFRDLKSPYISCNASIYPGVTHFGSSFEPTHDAVFRRIERDIASHNYLFEMRSIVEKQGGDKWKKEISENVYLFNTLALCASGNPRLLLKTIEKADKFKTNNVNTVIKEFYRSEIWLEHTSLGDKYRGHKKLVDWGRRFIEDVVIPVTVKKSEERLLRENKETTIYFWIQKDAPQQIKEALRLLTYTGIIRKYDSGVKATKSAIGDRYELKLGCVLAQLPSPAGESKDFVSNLKLDFFTEYGSNNSEYNSLTVESLNELTDAEFYASLERQMQKDIGTIGLTKWQVSKLREIGINLVVELLNVEETYLKNQVSGVGDIKARRIKNAAVAELLESISG